jgi:hypothetical protein
MKITSFIEDAQVIREILTHLGLWLVRSRSPPKSHDPPNIEYTAADYLTHAPHAQTDAYADPEYIWEMNTETGRDG